MTLAAIIAATIAVALVVRSMTSRFDGVLQMLSGASSLILAAVATSAMQGAGGMMALEMSESSFNIGVLPPVFIIATLTVMRGLFKIIQE
ncbi:hypothetical protein C7I85_16420 [Mesorhizobium soli]|uniref:Uncharacterized protein n=1 Tax=Pseudaminobacter soli (ex Li et al. 2025) TaxID=1295366 RepID=A0A2P7SBQ5_9HYPH|nr:hypothetical protein C7I85_16420 [Mesorhizobium soli]